LDSTDDWEIVIGLGPKPVAIAIELGLKPRPVDARLGVDRDEPPEQPLAAPA
jgi:hypothetical protein